MSGTVIELFPGRYDDTYDLNLIVKCRQCGKLLSVMGQFEGDEIVVMSTGAPIHGSCPSKRSYPSCSDKYADEIVAWERRDITPFYSDEVSGAMPGGERPNNRK